MCKVKMCYAWKDGGTMYGVGDLICSNFYSFDLCENITFSRHLNENQIESSADTLKSEKLTRLKTNIKEAKE